MYAKAPAGMFPTRQAYAARKIVQTKARHLRSAAVEIKNLIANLWMRAVPMKSFLLTISNKMEF